MTNENKGLNIQFFNLNAGFTLEEATKLIYQEVVKKEDLHKPRTIENIGIVSGVLALNDELEVVVQFYSEMQQYIKEEFENHLVITTNDA